MNLSRIILIAVSFVSRLRWIGSWIENLIRMHPCYEGLNGQLGEAQERASAAVKTMDSGAKRIAELEAQLAQFQVGLIPEFRIVDWSDDDQKVFGAFLMQPTGVKYRTFVELTAQKKAREACVTRRDGDLSRASEFQCHANMIAQLGGVNRRLSAEQMAGATVTPEEAAAEAVKRGQAPDPQKYKMPMDWKPPPFSAR